MFTKKSAKKFQNTKCDIKILKTDFSAKNCNIETIRNVYKDLESKRKKALASQPGEVTHAHACLSSKSCTRPLPVEGERECLEERTRERYCLDRSD